MKRPSQPSQLRCAGNFRLQSRPAVWLMLRAEDDRLTQKLLRTSQSLHVEAEITSTATSHAKWICRRLCLSLSPVFRSTITSPGRGSRTLAKGV